MSDGTRRDKVVIAAIGSEYRHDDGAGLAVARLVARTAKGIGDVGPLGEPLDLLGTWDDADLAVVIDTVRSGAPPGTVTVVELIDEGGPFDASVPPTTSTHGIGLIGALRIARATGHAPARVVLVAIEGTDFELGLGLSPAVNEAVAHATHRVIELLGVSV
jgi:hydrogenase maturation protease